MFFSPPFQVTDGKTLWEEFFQSSPDNVEKNYLSLKNFLEQHPERLKQEMDAFNEYLTNLKPLADYEWYLFDFLCVLGMFLAFCSGFDGMISVATIIMPELFFGLAIGLGVISAICALGIFLARDKLSIAEALGLELETTADQVDLYLFKLQRYYHLQKETKLSERNRENLSDFIHEYEMLKTLLEGKQTENQLRMEALDVNLQSGAVMFLGGLIMFSDAFFIGQSVGIFIATFLAAHMFALSLTLGLVVGLCGLASYLYVERPSLSRFLYGVIFTNQEETEERLTETQADVLCLRFGL